MESCRACRAIEEIADNVPVSNFFEGIYLPVLFSKPKEYLWIEKCDTKLISIKAAEVCCYS